MTPTDFLLQAGGAATVAARQVGFWPAVVFAQWADETAWGTAPAWVDGWNPAGISPGGVIARYPEMAAGVGAYIETANLPAYDPVRAAFKAGPSAQAVALGASPWAAGQYRLPGGIPGSALVAIIRDFDLEGYLDSPVPMPNPQPQQEPYMIPSNCTDVGAVKAQIREWWNLYRDDSMTVADQNLLALCFAEPVATGGFGGDPDLLQAHIVDTAGEHLRPAFVGAV